MCKRYCDSCLCGKLIPVRFQYCAVGLQAQELQKRGMAGDFKHPPDLYVSKIMRLCHTCLNLSRPSLPGSPQPTRPKSALPVEGPNHTPQGGLFTTTPKAPATDQTFWTNPHQYFAGLGVKNMPIETPGRSTASAKPISPTNQGKGLPKSLAERYEEHFPYPAEISASQRRAHRSRTLTPKPQNVSSTSTAQPSSSQLASSTASLDTMIAHLQLTGRINWAEAVDSVVLAVQVPPTKPVPKAPAPIIETVAHLAAAAEDDEGSDGSYRTASSNAGADDESASEHLEIAKLGGTDVAGDGEKIVGICDRGEFDESEWELIKPEVSGAETLRASAKDEDLEEWEFILSLHDRTPAEV